MTPTTHGEWNKNRNEFTEHGDTDSSSTNDHAASDELSNDLEHADTHDSDDSRDTTTMPSLEGDIDSSIQGRFWDHRYDSPDNLEPTLPHLSGWRPIKDHKRRRNLEYTLSHPNTDAALEAWKWVIRSNHLPQGRMYVAIRLAEHYNVTSGTVIIFR